MKKPIIAINANITKDRIYARLNQNYYRAILKAGGMPFILPCLPLSNNNSQNTILLGNYLDKIDGLLLSGADDLSPQLYNEKPLIGKLNLIPETKEMFDLQLTKLALRKKIPILGICYGAQLINVALGGSLFQNIPSQIKTARNHKNTYHKVYISELSLLYHIIGKKSILVNSSHHQSIKKPGKNLIVNARSEDCLIEGIEMPYHLKKPFSSNKFCLGIQWHPEEMLDKKEQVMLFRTFVKSAFIYGIV